MAPVELQVRILALDSADLAIQRDYLSLVDALEGSSQFSLRGPTGDPLEGHRAKSSVDIVVGAVHVIIPSSAAAAVLVAWIKSYYSGKSARKIELRAPDGRTVVLSGFDPEEIAQLLPDQDLRDPNALE